MGFIDGFLDKMKFGDNDDDDEQMHDDYEGTDEEVLTESKSRKKDKSETVYKDISSDNEVSEPARQPARPSKVARPSRTSSRTSSSSRVVRMGGSSPLEVCVIKPTNVEDGREIANTLLGGKAVVLNLEGIDVELAQRIIDFTSGACFAINGNLQKVSNYIFIITPESVDISGDFQGYISSEGSYAQELRF